MNVYSLLNPSIRRVKGACQALEVIEVWGLVRFASLDEQRPAIGWNIFMLVYNVRMVCASCTVICTRKVGETRHASYLALRNVSSQLVVKLCFPDILVF
jgi:hypothetical protein